MSHPQNIHSVSMDLDRTRVEVDIPDKHGWTEIWPGTENMQARIEDSNNDGRPDEILLWDAARTQLCDTELKLCVGDFFEVTPYTEEQAEFAEKFFAEGRSYAQGQWKTFLEANLLFSPQKIGTRLTEQGWSYEFPFLASTLGLLGYCTNFQELLENISEEDTICKPLSPAIDCVQNEGCYLDIPRGFGPAGQFTPALRVYLDPMAPSETSTFFDADSKKEVVASTTFNEGGGVSLQFRIIPATN